MRYIMDTFLVSSLPLVALLGLVLI